MSADLDLLESYSRTRDAQAFSALVETYSDMVYGTCLRILKNVAEAEDATQECFLRLARDSAKVHTSLGAWLHRCATNECISRVRSLSANHRRERAYEINRQEERKPSPWSEISDQVDKALEELPEELREVLVGHFLERRTQTELAAKLGVSPATMSRRINEGVEAIRKKLSKSGVIVSAVVLGVLLMENTAHAAPVTLLASLGKMALAGPGASTAAASVGGGTAASGVGTATTASSSLLSGKLLLAYTGAAFFAITAACALVWNYARHPHAASSPPATPDAPLVSTSENGEAARLQAIAALTPDQRHTYELLYQLRIATPPEHPAAWVKTVQELAAKGKSAVPSLAAELDASHADGEQRLLLLTLRTIGDPRAVPAIIRAIPRVSPAYLAYEIPVKDHDSLTFLASHTVAHSSAEHWGLCSVDAGITQCIAALESMTHHSEGHEAITNGARSDDPAEVRRDMALRDELVDRWSQWWKLHGKELVTSVDLATLDNARTDLTTLVGIARFGPIFPATLHPGPLQETTLAAAGTWDADAYIDFDNHRVLQHNEGWQNVMPLDVEKGDWIAQAGVDAYARLTHPAPPADRMSTPHLCMLQARGLTAWQVPNGRFEQVDAELRSGKPLDLGIGAPTATLLPTDAKTGAPRYTDYPATFLIATREGGRGIVQIQGLTNEGAALRLRYRMFEGTTPQQPPLQTALASHEESAQTGAFGDVQETTLASPLLRDDSALELHTGKALPQLIDPDQPMFTLAKRQWLETWGGDLLTLTWPNHQLCGLGGDQMLALEVSPAAWDALSPTQVHAMLARRDPSEINSAGSFMIPDPNHTMPATWIFRTRAGETGLLQISELSNDHLTVRYKLVQGKN